MMRRFRYEGVSERVEEGFGSEGGSVSRSKYNDRSQRAGQLRIGLDRDRDDIQIIRLELTFEGYGCNGCRGEFLS